MAIAPDIHSQAGMAAQSVTQEKIRYFFANTDRIISGIGGSVEASIEQRKVCLLFNNGDFLIDRNHCYDIQVRIFRDICLRKKILIRSTYAVDMKLIRLLYEKSEENKTFVVKESKEPMEILASQMLQEASQMKTSDIHIKVYQKEAEVWYRINGDMVMIREFEASLAHSLLSALYNAADDADATYRIYDYQAARIAGNARLSLPKELQAIRLQFNPLGGGGRYLIARLLYAENWWDQNLELSNLGFNQFQIQQLGRLRQLPEGVNIISGPTGSGKSTTLKMVMELLYEERERKINILTIEDPPEYEIHGAVQLPVTNVDTEEERGHAYGKAITAALRSDPDVIMPGEARDSAVIQLVFTAAMTGHQVWTSLHANNSLAVFDRLKDQGVESYKLSDPSLVTGIISQRLLKKLCSHCSHSLVDFPNIQKQGINYSIVENCVGIERVKNVKLRNIDGCQYCKGGFVGRSVVAEVLLPDQYFLDLIVAGKRSEAKDYWLGQLQGMTMAEHAWIKIINGLVDPFDIWSKISHLDKISDDRKKQLEKMV